MPIGVYKHRPHTEDQKRKIGNASRGHMVTPAMRIKIGLAHKGKIVSEETREKLRKVSSFRKGFTPWNKGKKFIEISGERNVNWRGGVTKANHAIRSSVEYKIWRRAVFERDGYTCIWCGVRSSKGVKVVLHADHIKQFAYYPELRFAIDNGRTLCEECHKTTDTFNRRIR